jgi:hypothetical protein
VIEEVGLSGSPLPLSLAISGRLVRVSFFNHRPPAHLRKQGSSSRTLCSSTEYCPLRSALNPKTQSAFLGVRGPSSRHLPSASCAPGHSRLPGALPPSTFLTSSTVSSAVGFVGLFHPTATSRVHSSGVSFLVRSRVAFRQPLPSRRSFRLSYRQLPTCSTSSVRALRAFIRVRIRNPISGG